MAAAVNIGEAASRAGSKTVGTRGEDGFTFDWRVLDGLLQEALGLSLEKRRQFVEGVGDRDPALREELESLLALEETARAFAETPVFPRQKEEGVELTPGTRIGPYQLGERIARGGMGTVWSGLRVEGEFEQRVAIKVLRRGKESEEILSRFRHERQILANLKHPHIAKLLDGGTTEDGRPFFIMEHVEGRPLDEFCEAANLSLEERLRIFLTICGAVDHAHRNLVVHRDLKPANILVTADRVPVLLDFGIAKILSPEVPAPTEQFPMASRFATRGYGSPEQISGNPISVASDIFSLGVLLFEVISGTKPPADFYPSPHYRQAPAKGQGGKREKIEGKTKKLPSSPEIDEDLEAIVRTAMQENPDERYQNVRDLALEIHRFLDLKPVAARRGNLWYRGRKLMRRNPWKAVAVGGCLILLAVILLLGARNRAVESENAHLKDNLLDVYVMSLRFTNSKDLARALESSTESLEEMLLETDLEFFETPNDRAAFLDLLGQQDRLTGDLESARSRFLESLSIRRQFLEPNDPYIALSLEQLALLDTAPEKAAEGILLVQEALEIRRQVGDAWVTANTLNDLALLTKAGGRWVDAVEVYQESLALVREVVGEKDDVLVASLLNNLGTSLREIGHLAEAEALLTEAFAMRQRLHGARDSRGAVVQRNLGHLYLLQGRVEEAGDAFHESLKVRQEEYGDSTHPSVAKGQRSLGLYHLARGDFEEADRLLSMALSSLEGRYGAEHSQVVRTQRALAALRLEQGRPLEARNLAEVGLGFLRGSLPPEHWHIADMECLLAASWLQLGDPVEARALLIPAHQRLLKAKGEKSAETVYAADLLFRLKTI